MTKLEEIIKVLEKEIEELSDIYNFVDKRETYYYKNKMESLRRIFPPSYEVKEDLEGKEKLLELYKRLQNENVDVSGRHYLMDNVCIDFWLTDTRVRVGIYFENDSWYYENFMSSHSELNIWLEKVVLNLSDECSEFVNSTLIYLFRTVNKGEKYTKDINIDEILKAIKDIIHFCDEDNLEKDIITKQLQLKFDLIHENVVEE